MIIPFNKINDPGFEFGWNVFQGTIAADPEDTWESLIPDIANLSTSALANPALAANLAMSASDEASALGESGNMHDLISKYVARKAMKEWVMGTRQTLGTVAQTAGIVGADLLDVREICMADASELTKAISIADVVVDSKPFQMALDALGAIPIVGWVIKAAFDISKTIAQAIEMAEKAKDAAARRELAKKLTVPLGATNFDVDANDALARAFFGYLKGNKADDLIRPMYGGELGYSGVYDDKIPDSIGKGLASGYIINGAPTGKFGYVPGTSSLTGALFFSAGLKGRGCDAKAVRDMGTLYPSAQNLCTSWWSQINKPGPSMFSVRPGTAISEWEDYIDQMFWLAENTLKGWSCAPTGKPFTDEFKCLSSLKGDMGNCKGSPGSTVGDWLKIPSEFGRMAHTSIYGYLCELYFGLVSPFDQKSGGLERLPRIGAFKYENDLGHEFYSRQSLDLSKSVPVEALNILRENQKATLGSIQCMYVAGDEPNWNRFQAFKDASLRDAWNDGVRDVFQSGAWKRVSFQDMPEGEAKSYFYNWAKDRGIDDVENFNRPCAPGEKPHSSGCGFQGISKTLAMGGPPITPTLPQKPPMNGAVIQASIKRTIRPIGKSSSKKKTSNLPLIVGAGALALLFMKGRK